MSSRLSFFPPRDFHSSPREFHSSPQEFHSCPRDFQEYDTITNTLQKRFAFRRKDEQLSKSTGLDIFYTEEGIIMKQNDHRDELEEIKIENNKEPDRELNLDEYAKFRGKWREYNV